MGKAYIDLRVHFDVTDEDDYLYYDPVSVENIGGTVPSEDLDGIGEAAFQTDKYTVNVSNALLSALDGRHVDVD